MSQTFIGLAETQSTLYSLRFNLNDPFCRHACGGYLRVKIEGRNSRKKTLRAWSVAMACQAAPHG